MWRGLGFLFCLWGGGGGEGVNGKPKVFSSVISLAGFLRR